MNVIIIFWWSQPSVVSADKFRLRLSHRRLFEDQIFSLSQSAMMLKWCLGYWLSSVCPLYSSSSTRLVKVTAFSNLPGSAVCMNIKASHCLDYQEGVCVCVCVPEQSLKWICSASGQFRVGFSFFNSELSSLLSCNKTWFCFRTLYWISYKYKHKKSLEIKATHFHWVSSLISPCHLLSQQILTGLQCKCWDNCVYII